MLRARASLVSESTALCEPHNNMPTLESTYAHMGVSGNRGYLTGVLIVREPYWYFRGPYFRKPPYVSYKAAAEAIRAG